MEYKRQGFLTSMWYFRSGDSAWPVKGLRETVIAARSTGRNKQLQQTQQLPNTEELLIDGEILIDGEPLIHDSSRTNPVRVWISKS